MGTDPVSGEVRFSFDGRNLVARSGDSVAVALLAAGEANLRETPVSGALRAPYCMIAVCFDCPVEIDGVGNRQACLVPVVEGTQVGASVALGARCERRLGYCGDRGRPGGACRGYTACRAAGARNATGRTVLPGGQIYRDIERVGERPALLAARGANYTHGAEPSTGFRVSGAGYRPDSVVSQVTPDR